MTIELIEGDCREVLKELDDQSVNCIVTSPPYFGLRDYGVENQMGLEPTPAEFVEALVGVMREARRVLRDDGTLWLNLGDSYSSGGGSHDNRDDNQLGVGAKRIWRDGSGRADGIVDARGQRNRNGILTSGLPNKNLIGIPWRVAFALQADGWYLRQDIIWHKPNPMPESVRDRCTKAHEYIFLLSKSPTYYFDWQAMQEPVAESTKARLAQPTLSEQAGSTRVPGKTNGNMKAVGNSEMRNRRSVWTITTKPFKEAHFATFPPDLIEPCVLAGCPEGGVVLDPFFGAGTTGVVCQRTGRDCIGIELNPAYYDIAAKRLGLDEALQANK